MVVQKYRTYREQRIANSKVHLDEQEIDKRRKLLRPEALAGNVNAQFNLGALSMAEFYRAEKQSDKTEGELWLHMAAQQGHKEAQEMMKLVRSSK